MRIIGCGLLFVAIDCAHINASLDENDKKQQGQEDQQAQAHRDQQRQHDEALAQQRWDDLCKNPPTADDWREWCTRRAAQRQLEVAKEIAQTTNDEHAAAAVERQRAEQERQRAERHRQDEDTRDILNASQAPFQTKN